MLGNWLSTRSASLSSILVALVVVLVSAVIGLRSPQFSDVGGITMQSVAPLLAGFGILSAFGLAVVNLRLALVLLIATAGLVEIPLGTGTQTNITTVMLVLPTIALAWILQWLIGRRTAPLGDARLNRPIGLFLLILGGSWAANLVLIDVRVLLPGNALLVQGTQVALYLLTFVALLLTASVKWTERSLRVCVAATIGMSMLAVVAGNLGFVSMGPLAPATPMSIGAVLLLGQLILNTRLSDGARLLGWLLLAAWGAGTFLTFRYTYAGGWLPVLVALPVLLWLRSRRLAVFATLAGAIFVWFNRARVDDFLAFKDSVGSLLRPYIWLDVVRMTVDSVWHVLLGLGPVTYKWNWFNPDFVSLSRPLTGNSYVGTGDASVYYAPPSHNFFADLFAQTGLLGTLVFVWLLIVIVVVGWRATQSAPAGFARAHAGGALASLFAMAVVSVASAEWLVPFVYNLGTAGFRQSVYTWLMLGTLVSLGRFGVSIDGVQPAPDQTDA
ncbi:MAG: hypothetical protein HZB53_09055 [Chloroflexi bacterium]|nr:hypothetical protein [Chloroflexota bacterium]